MPELLKTLKEKLKNWEDIDIVQHELGILLGIVDESKGSFAREYKWVYWSNNPVGNALHDILMNLVEIEFLEYDEDEGKLRFNHKFDVLHDYPNRA
jgi:hypothetical protein